MDLQRKKKEIANTAYGDTAGAQQAQRLTADDIRFLFRSL